MDRKKSIIESNWVFSFSIVLLIFSVLIIWMLFTPTPYTPTSGDEIILHDHEGIYNVNNEMDVLEDVDGNWTIEDVQTPTITNQFQPASGENAFELTDGTYWIRTTIINESSLEQWVIRLNNSVIEQFDMYVIDEKSVGSGHSSIIEKVNEHFSSYYIHLTNDNVITIYMKSVINGSMIIPIELMDNQSFLNKLKNEYMFFGIYYGFVLLMSAYMFSMYIFNRMKAYLYYSLYILCFSVSQLVLNGLLKELLGADSQLLAFLLRIFGNYESIDHFFFIASLWFGLLFLGRILQLEVYAPRMMIIYRLLNIMSPLVLIAALFHFPGYPIFAILYKSMFAILLIISTYWSVYKGNLAARYVILATIPFLGLATPTILNSFSLMQESFLTHYGFQLGSITGYIIFSIALSYQLRQTRLDKESALQQILINDHIQQNNSESFEGNESEEGDIIEMVQFEDWIEREFISLASMIQLAGKTYDSSIYVDPLAIIAINSHDIRRVLSNLVDNACKFTFDGGMIHLYASSRNGEVFVCVEDNGKGIGPEHLQSIFDRDYQVVPTNSSSGSGLGLAIAKEIIERHKGQIWVESQPGRGSLFYFKLPVRIQAA